MAVNFNPFNNIVTWYLGNAVVNKLNILGCIVTFCLQRLFYWNLFKSLLLDGSCYYYLSFILPSFCFFAFFSLGLGFLFIWVSLDVYVYSVFNETGSYLHAKNQLHHLLFLRYCAKKQQINILGNLAMPGSTHLKWQYHLGEIWCLPPGYLFNLILHVFVEILLRYCKLVVLGTLGMPGYTNSEWYYPLVEKL